MVYLRLECANCGHRWWKWVSRGFVSSLEKFESETLPRDRCPECRKYTRPRIVQVREERP